MAEITAALVMELRAKSGVGMMDCKKALQETDGDINAAIDWLRAKGLAKAAKKSTRVAAEGGGGPRSLPSPAVSCRPAARLSPPASPARPSPAAAAGTLPRKGLPGWRLQPAITVSSIHESLALTTTT